MKQIRNGRKLFLIQKKNIYKKHTADLLGKRSWFSP